MPQDNNDWSRASNLSRGRIIDVQGRVRDQEPLPAPMPHPGEPPPSVPQPYPYPDNGQPTDHYEPRPDDGMPWPPTMVSLAEGARVDSISGRPIHEFTGLLGPRIVGVDGTRIDGRRGFEAIPSPGPYDPMPPGPSPEPDEPPLPPLPPPAPTPAPPQPATDCQCYLLVDNDFFPPQHTRKRGEPRRGFREIKVRPGADVFLRFEVHGSTAPVQPWAIVYFAKGDSPSPSGMSFGSSFGSAGNHPSVKGQSSCPLSVARWLRIEDEGTYEVVATWGLVECAVTIRCETPMARPLCSCTLLLDHSAFPSAIDRRKGVVAKGSTTLTASPGAVAFVRFDIVGLLPEPSSHWKITVLRDGTIDNLGITFYSGTPNGQRLALAGRAPDTDFATEGVVACQGTVARWLRVNLEGDYTIIAKWGVQTCTAKISSKVPMAWPSRPCKCRLVAIGTESQLVGDNTGPLEQLTGGVIQILADRKSVKEDLYLILLPEHGSDDDKYYFEIRPYEDVIGSQESTKIELTSIGKGEAFPHPQGGLRGARYCPEHVLVRVSAAKYSEATAAAENARRLMAGRQDKVAPGEVVAGTTWLVATFNGDVCGVCEVRVTSNEGACLLSTTLWEAREKQRDALDAGVSLQVPPIEYQGIHHKEFFETVDEVSRDKAAATFSKNDVAAVRFWVSLKLECGMVFTTQDCCCLFVAKAVMTLHRRVFYPRPDKQVQGDKKAALERSARETMSSTLSRVEALFGSEEWRAKVAVLLGDVDPSCSNRDEASCRALRDDPSCGDELSKKVKGDVAVLFADLAEQHHGNASETGADVVGGRTRAAGAWDEVKQRAYCDDVGIPKPLPSIAVTVYNCGGHAEKDIRSALAAASQIALQCCVEIKLQAIIDKSKDAKLDVKWWGFEADQSKFRKLSGQYLLLVGPEESDWAKDVKRAGEQRSEGIGLTGVVGGAKGKLSALWVVSGRGICHELGHNAGLSHIGHRQEVHVMGNDPTQGTVGTALAMLGTGWTPEDCVAMRELPRG